MATSALAEDCLVKLREYVEGLGGKLEGEWHCKAQMRESGSRSGSVDMWFKAPGGEVYRSKVAVARGLGLLEPAPPPAPRGGSQAADGGGSSSHNTRKPRRELPPPLPRGPTHKPSAPWSSDLTVPDLAELLMSMPDGDLEGRYQGRLTWKGQTNIRNPAIAVALEVLLERGGVARKDSTVVAEPAAPVAMPLQRMHSEPQLVMNFELPPGSLPAATVEQRVSVELQLYGDGNDDAQPVRLKLSVLEGPSAAEQAKQDVAQHAQQGTSLLAQHPAPVALITVPVVKSEQAGVRQPVALLSALRPSVGLPTGCPAASFLKEEEQAEQAQLGFVATPSVGSGSQQARNGGALDSSSPPMGSRRRKQQRDGGAAAVPVAATPGEDGPVEAVLACEEDGRQAMDVDGAETADSGSEAPLRAESPASWLSGLDESVADALLGLPDAAPPILSQPYCPHYQPTQKQQQQQGYQPQQHHHQHQHLPQQPQQQRERSQCGGNTGGGAGGSALLRPPRPSVESLRGKSPVQVEAALMERLRRYVSNLGHELPPGWSVKASVRKTGVSAGGIDAYYYAPGGKRCKSMIKVAEMLGLGTDAPAPHSSGRSNGHGKGSGPAMHAVHAGSIAAGRLGTLQQPVPSPHLMKKAAALALVGGAGAPAMAGSMLHVGAGRAPLVLGAPRAFGFLPPLNGAPQFPPSPQPATQPAAFLSPEIEQPVGHVSFPLPPAHVQLGPLPLPPASVGHASGIAGLQPAPQQQSMKAAAGLGQHAVEATPAQSAGALGPLAAGAAMAAAAPHPSDPLQQQPPAAVAPVPQAEEHVPAVAAADGGNAVAGLDRPNDGQSPALVVTDGEAPTGALRQHAGEQQAGQQQEQGQGQQQQPEQQPQQDPPPLQASDVQQALAAAMAAQAQAHPGSQEQQQQPLQPLRVPRCSPGVGRLGRRDQLLAGKKRRRGRLLLQPGSPGGSGDDSGSDEEGEGYSRGQGQQSSGAASSGESGSDSEADSEPGEGADADADGLPDAASGGRGVELPGGVDVASREGGNGKGGDTGRQQKGGGSSKGDGGTGRKRSSSGNGDGGGGGKRGSSGAGGSGGGGGRKPGGGDDRGNGKRTLSKKKSGKGFGKADEEEEGGRQKRKRSKKTPFSPSAAEAKERSSKAQATSTTGQKDKQQRRRRRRQKKAQEEPGRLTSSYDRVLNRLRSQLSRLRQEQMLVEAYAADGWRGASREKVKPVAEIKRAKEQIARCKEVIRECVQYCDEAEGDAPIPQDLFDETGELDCDHMFCSKCRLNHSSDDNDIILCDGPCNRAYHVRCLVPPVDPEALPEEEGWLCPACDHKCDMVDLINDEFGTEYELETPWQQILAPGTLPKSPNTGVPGSPHALVDLNRLEGLLEGADLPSEDEEDSDYVESGSEGSVGVRQRARSGPRGGGSSPSQQDSSSSDDAGDAGSGDSNSDYSDSGGARGSRRSAAERRGGSASGSEGGGSSEPEGSSLESDELRGEVEALGADAGADAGLSRRSRSRGASSPRGGVGDGGSEGEEGDEEDGKQQKKQGSGAGGGGEADPSLIINTKRRRVAVDYLALSKEMFGDVQAHGDELGDEEEEEDGVWSPTVRRKRGPRQPKDKEKGSKDEGGQDTGKQQHTESEGEEEGEGVEEERQQGEPQATAQQAIEQQ